MSGIYERLKRDGTDRINAHLLDAAFLFNTSEDFTTQQVLAAINSTLDTPLSGDELTDLAAIQAQLDAQGTAFAKLIYYEKLAAAAICVEMGVMNENGFRSVLGIA